MADKNTGVFVRYAKTFYNGKKEIAERQKPQDVEIYGEEHATSASITPSVSSNEKEEKSTFSTIRQGTATNTLTKVKSTKRNTVIDPISNTATIKQGSLTITSSVELTGFKTSTYQLLDALTVALTESGARSPTVTLTLEEYMAKRGLKDEKEARKQVAADLEILFNAKLSFKEKRGKKQELDFHDMRIIDGKGIRKGIISVTFGTPFYNILLGYPIMPYPAQLWTLNVKTNPNSFYLLRKIAEHKNMNVGKKNEDIIAVKTLLAAAPNLPSYEEVMVAGRQLNQRIIEPFERDMNALEDTLSWEYCHSNNAPLTNEDLDNLCYDTFKDLLIHVTWNKYPNQTARLERKAKRIEQANKGRKKKEPKEKQPDKM